MNEKLSYLIKRHREFMDMGTLCTKRILKASQEGRVNQADQESENRERLVNIIGNIQSAIEKEIQAMPLEGDSIELINLVKAWNNDIEHWLEKISCLDLEIIESLQDEKTNTTKEIASTYQNREKFKGYNLNNVKK